MNEAVNATCSTSQNYAIGSYFNATQAEESGIVDDQPPTDCTPYSGENKNSIVATTISRDLVTVDNTTNITTIVTQTGVSIQYIGGSSVNCSASSFTIKSWCNSTMATEDTSYSGLANADDFCNPYVEIESPIGGCDLFSNSIIWTYLDMAKPYFGIAGIAVGFLMAFFGFRLLKPAVGFACVIICTMISMFVFYAVYITSTD
jgi:hypothetical protein